MSERDRRKAAEMREMIREAAAGMEAAGMIYVSSYPRDHVESRRLWVDYRDTRSITGRLMGDPIPERSALTGGSK